MLNYEECGLSSLWQCSTARVVSAALKGPGSQGCPCRGELLKTQTKALELPLAQECPNNLFPSGDHLFSLSALSALSSLSSLPLSFFVFVLSFFVSWLLYFFLSVFLSWAKGATPGRLRPPPLCPRIISL